MTDSKTNQGMNPSGLPAELTLEGMRKRIVSPLNDLVWRFLLLASGGCVLAWAIASLFGFRTLLVLWLTAILILASWGAAVRMLFIETRARIFWIVWLAAGLLALLVSSRPSGTWIASAFSFVFLLFRRYRPYRHLASRRQAWLFLIGILVFAILTIAWPSSRLSMKAETPLAQEATSTSVPAPAPDAFLVKGEAFLGYGLDSLRFFWFFSLFNLFFSIRLHFMRLKPKLAVSAFLIAVFPVLLVIIMGLITLYSLLGESRALRAGGVLKDWAGLSALNENFIPSISKRGFSYEVTPDTGEEHLAIRGEKAPWLDKILSALKGKNFVLPELARKDEAAYFWIEGEVWLVDLSRAGGTPRRVQGCQLDSTMLGRLARILNCDVELYQSNPINLLPQASQRKTDIQVSQKDIESAVKGRLEAVQKEGSGRGLPSPSLWLRNWYFGMSNLDVIAFSQGQFEKRIILLSTKASLAGIFNELLSGTNPLNNVVLAILAAVAIFLLILEAFALFFGVRITSGITRAVKTLHKGTKRIAEGDLDTPIEIPNEDEFGDLAFSFNQMSAAVKKGREEAISRGVLERELQTAREIQQNLLPHEMPRIPGFEICGISLPSRQVGGDYFDFLEMESGDLGIAIGDVSGKGMPAALLMANVQASLHAQAIRTAATAELVSRMNNQLVQSTDKHMFVTFCYGILNRNASRFIWTNAGHNPPLLFRADGELQRLESSGLMLGFLADQAYLQQETVIQPGDILVLYTDGITEASAFREEGKRELFGEQRLIDIIGAGRTLSASEIQSSILRTIKDYTGDTPPDDDITLVVIKRIKL